MPIVDGALVFDNSEGKHELLAKKTIDGFLNIVNQEKFNLLKIAMTTIEIQTEEINKILKGFENVYEKLIEFKKAKNSELVIIRNNKIIKIKPE